VLPEGVVITSLQHEDVEAHDQTVCSVTEPKLIIEEEEVEDTIDSELDEEGDAEGAEDSEDAKDAKDSQDGDTEE
jgi:large subunit ribosomal protein L25